VAWAGAQTAHAWPFEGDPSDIYYATSKDGGKTWKKPLKVTDRFKDGITSGSARVALQMESFICSMPKASGIMTHR